MAEHVPANGQNHRRDALAERLASIRERHPASEPEVVAEVVQAVLSTMSGDLTARATSVLTEVEALGRTIATAKSEIAALRVDDITGSHIPFATDELDAIVEHTAAATNAILNSCEILDEVAARGGLYQLLERRVRRNHPANAVWRG